MVIDQGKLLQLHLDEEVSTEKSSAQRSTTTGELVITMPKLALIGEGEEAIAKLTLDGGTQKSTNKTSLREKKGVGNLFNITNEQADITEAAENVKPIAQCAVVAQGDDDDDDDDIPPL